MGSLPYDVFAGVLSGVVFSVLAYEATVNSSLIRSWFNSELRRQAGLIEGTWEAEEVFSHDGSIDVVTMKLNCLGNRVTGTCMCLSGPDKGKEFHLVGMFKDMILTLMWTKQGRTLESGTFTLRLVNDGEELRGHGLYIEPGDGEVYPSRVTAKH